MSGHVTTPLGDVTLLSPACDSFCTTLMVVCGIHIIVATVVHVDPLRDAEMLTSIGVGMVHVGGLLLVDRTIRVDIEPATEKPVFDRDGKPLNVPPSFWLILIMPIGALAKPDVKLPVVPESSITAEINGLALVHVTVIGWVTADPPSPGPGVAMMLMFSEVGVEHVGALPPG